MAEPTQSFDEFQEAEPREPQLHISDYWAILLKHRRLIVACVAVALVTSILVTALSRPMYRATVVLDIVRQTSNPLGFDPSVGNTGGGNESEFLPSQIELLKSRDVAERVVKKLNLTANPTFRGSDAPVRMLEKTPVPQPPSSAELERASLRVKENADATIVRGTSLVQLSYEAPTSKLAADVANGMADAYIEWNIESRFRQIGRSAEFLAAQIEQAKREIEQKDKALLAFQRRNEIVGVDPKTNSPQSLESITRDYSSAVTERVTKEARYQELQNTPGETLAETSVGGILSQLRAEQSRLERDYAEKLGVYKPEFPAMQQLKKQIDDGRQRIESAIQDTATKVREAGRSEYMTALRRESNLKEMMRAQQTEALNQGSNTSEYNNLRVEVDTKRALLDSLLKQQGEAEVLSRLRETQLINVRIVDRALPPGSPFRPSAPHNLTVAILLGLGGGIAAAFFLSYLDRSLRTTDQVESYLQLPSLGAVPYLGPTSRRLLWKRDAQVPTGPEAAPSMGPKMELMPHLETRSSIAEAYRAFRTALLFSRAGGVRTVTITSIVPQEGKSATAVNLAVVLAQLGRRVLLVDADLHRGRLHEVLGLPNKLGLVSILAEGMEPSRVIVKSHVPNVYLVPAGPESPNPSGLLSSDAMRRFLELASSNFDHVVVDTPPVLATSDVLVFGQHTDGVVICVRAGRTPREQVRRVRDKLLRGGVPILGVLLNGLELDSNYYGGYEYRHLNYGERAKAASDERGPASEAG
jgi:succinoglycan biosynthesis transport protein ExoP